MSSKPDTDPILALLAKSADDTEVSWDAAVTVMTGGARIEGHTTSRIAYGEYFRDALAEGFRAAAERDPDNVGARALAEQVVEVLTPSVSAQADERRALARKLRDMPDGDPEAEELQKRLDNLTRQDVLVLRDASVWGPGFNPLSGPIRVPFVRVPFAAVDAWWLGASQPAGDTSS